MNEFGTEGKVMCFWHGWSLWNWTRMSIVYSSSLLFLLQFCRLPLHACSEATLRGIIDLLLHSLPLPPISCSPCLCFSHLSPVFLPFAGNPHPLVIVPVFCRLENASHYFSHFARDACLHFLSLDRASKPLHPHPHHHFHPRTR